MRFSVYSTKFNILTTIQTYLNFCEGHACTNTSCIWF